MVSHLFYGNGYEKKVGVVGALPRCQHGSCQALALLAVRVRRFCIS